MFIASAPVFVQEKMKCKKLPFYFFLTRQTRLILIKNCFFFQRVQIDSSQCQLVNCHFYNDGLFLLEKLSNSSYNARRLIGSLWS